MQDKAALETFIKSSSYTSPQYIKRLKFIFSAICQYAQSKNKSIEELEILEFGCGTGRITFPLASLGSHVTAFDIDPSAVSGISERIQKEKLNNVTVTQGIVNFIPGKGFLRCFPSFPSDLKILANRTPY